VTEIDPKLSRLYRGASSEGPPAAVDAAILAAARKQAPGPQRRERPSWLRWMAPASAMATLALGVSLALLVERERPQPLDDAAGRAIPPRPQSRPPVAPAVTESPTLKSAAGAAPGAAAKREAPAASAPPQAPAPADSASAPAHRLAEPAAPAADAFTAERRAKAAASGTARESNAGSDAALRGPEAAAPAAPAAADKLAPLRPPSAQRSPEAWLDEISRLRREGREAEAALQLAEFRKAHPGYALPEGLLPK
jgi:hypothetical protein